MLLLNIILATLDMIWLMYSDATMDKIMFYRLHYSAHPLRDWWHLHKHFVKISNFLLGVLYYHGAIIIYNTYGYFIRLTIVYFVILMLTYMLIAIILKYALWDYIVKKEPKKAYKKDETFQMPSFGKYLDKLLGFHH